MLPSRMVSAMSWALTSCGWSQLETLKAARPPSTSRWVSHETGAMFVYHGHDVWFEWQSPQDAMKSDRVCGESHAGSLVVAGFVWLCP